MARLAKIPTTLEEITVDVIRTTLQDQGAWAQHITGIELPNETAFQGAMSTVVKIALQYDNNELITKGPSHIVAKMLPTNSHFAAMRVTGSNVLLAYRKEAEFCRMLLNRQKTAPQQEDDEFIASFPKIYFVQVGNEESAAEVAPDAPFFIVMQYISGAKQQVQGLTMDESRAALKSVANLHAKFWHMNNAEERAKIIATMKSDYGYPVQFEFAKYWLVALLGVAHHNENKSTDADDKTVHATVFENLKTSWPSFAKVMTNFNYDKFPEMANYKLKSNVEKLAKFMEGDAALVKTMIGEAMQRICGKGHYQTLLHSDFRTENVVFEGEHSAKLIDLQCLNFGNVGFDLAHFLATSLPAQQRREQEKQLLQEYLEHLYRLNPLIKTQCNYTFETLWNDYQLAAMFHAVLMIGGASKWLPWQENNTLETMFGRYLFLAMYMVEGDIDLFLNALEAKQ